MTRVPQRCLERVAARVGRGISDGEFSQTLVNLWLISSTCQQTHPGEGPHKVVYVNIGFFCVDVGADLQQVLSNRQRVSHSLVTY